MKHSLVFIFITILLAGCGSSRPTLQYEAVATPGVSAFFLDGTSVASCATDSCFFSLAIDERSVVGGYGYLRTWFLYQNRSAEPYLLRPWKILRLDIIDSTTGEVYPLAAATPGMLLARIDKQEASQNLMTFLGGVTQSLRVASSDLPAREKIRAHATVTGALATDFAWDREWFSILRSSVSSGVLQKNSVLPGESVNGYVLFPLQTEKRSFTNALFSSGRWRCVFTVSTPTGERKIGFLPVSIE